MVKNMTRDPKWEDLGRCERSDRWGMVGRCRGKREVRCHIGGRGQRGGGEGRGEG